MSNLLKIGIITGFVLGAYYVYNNIRKNRVWNESLFDERGRDCVLEEGEIYVWKACVIRKIDKTETFVYVKLFVPKDAKKVTPLWNNLAYKSRIEYGRIADIVDEDDNHYTMAESIIYTDSRTGKPLQYIMGEFVIPNAYNSDINNSCGAGINVHRHKNHCRQWFACDES